MYDLLKLVLRANRPYTQGVDDEPLILNVPLEHILRLRHPLQEDVWDCGIVTVKDVLSCPDIQAGAEPGEQGAGGSHAFHTARIAYLATIGPKTNDDQPVTVDVGAFGYMPAQPIRDGHHRVAAAVVRGDYAIEVQIEGDEERGLAILLDGLHPDEC
jgi:hypothetical protein